MKKLLTALVASLAFSVAGAQTLVMTPDTSANPNTVAFPNGNLAGSESVSKVNIHSLLYPGNTTKVLVHYLPWFDGNNDTGINAGYSNGDATYINSFFTDIVSRGVDGVMVDWQGQTDITDTNWLVSVPIIHNYTALSGDKLFFAIMLDLGLLNNYSGTNQEKVLAALSYVNTHYLSDSSYLTYNGKPVVAEFGLTSQSGIDWAAIQAAYPGIQFIHEDNATSPDGFSITSSAGSFLWFNAPPSPQNPIPPDLSYLDDFYTRANLHPTQIAVGAAYKGFNSALAPWIPQLNVDQQCGETWLNTFTKINQYYNSAKQLPFLQLVTWDDYYEGTALETGIDNCLTRNIYLSGSPPRTINVSFTHSDTVDHWELWAWNGSSWNSTNEPVSTTAVTVSPGYYYVKIVGKPFIKNILSSRIPIN